MSAGKLQWMMEQLGNTGRAMRLRIVGWRAARRALRVLELGRNPDGSMAVLDYRSGQLLTRRTGRPLAVVQQVVSFEYADLAWLERVIALGGYAVSIDADGDLAVRTPAGLVFVRRDEHTAVLRFFMRVIDRVDLITEEVADMINVLNLQATLGRWVQNENGTLYMSCDLYAGVGMTSAQVLSAVRACSHEVGTATAALGLDQNTT